MANQQGGVNDLARVLTDRMKQTQDKDNLVDFGTIGNGGHLTTDHLQVMMETDDYSKLDGLTLTKGDRVLVIWVDTEPVVIGKIER